MAYPKYIIEDNCLIIGRVTRHYQLALNKEKVQGGGVWYIDHDTKECFLSGESSDFGSPTFEEVKKAVLEGNVYTNKAKTNKKFQDYTFYFKEDFEFKKIENSN